MKFIPSAIARCLLQARATGTLLLVLTLMSCDRAVGPQPELHLVSLNSATALIGEPGKRLSGRVRFKVTDHSGVTLRGTSVQWATAAVGSRIDNATLVPDADGEVSAEWLLGTNASEVQTLTIRAKVAGAPELRATIIATSVPSVAAELFTADSLRLRVAESHQLVVSAADSFGNPFTPSALSFTPTHPGIVAVDSTGRLTTIGRGKTTLSVQAGYAVRRIPVEVNQVVASLTAADTMTFDALLAARALPSSIKDDLGNEVADTIIGFSVADSSIIHCEFRNGQVWLRALRNGSTLVRTSVGGFEDTTMVMVRQRAARILIPDDTLRFDALGATSGIIAVVVDSLGSVLTGSFPAVSIGDTAVLKRLDSTVVRSIDNGISMITLQYGNLAQTLTAVVTQRATALEVQWTDTSRIIANVFGGRVPLRCAARDRNGYEIATAEITVVSRQQRVTGDRCGTLMLARSGHDTLHVRSGDVMIDVPLVSAVAPTLTQSFGRQVIVDSLPSGGAYMPWAPSLRRNSSGQLELYAALFEGEESQRAHLHRFVSTNEGASFRYDGIAIRRDTTPCSARDTGVENMAIVPRAEGSGWRMFFAAGSNNCYGWQVFSAVSTDERSWVIESGVRLGNGGSLPPDQPTPALWPVGEGMVVDRLSNGTWRMIVSGYEPTLPRRDQWQISEWRSRDQINWTHTGTLLDTRDMPAQANGNLYSPTIREISPGLWRMIFTGDNRGTAEWQSRLFSAVSTDRSRWQVEGPLLSGVGGYGVYYSAVVDDHLVFVAHGGGLQSHLRIATLVTR